MASKAATVVTDKITSLPKPCAVVFLFFSVLLGGTAVANSGPSSPGPEKIEVVEGIYLFISPNIDHYAVEGNCIVIVNDHDVLVFDANQLPSSARAILTEIRKITDKPVRYVVNSHWHPDHWSGNEAYAQEFPGVEFIASEDTRRIMRSVTNVATKYIERGIAANRTAFEKQLQTGKNADGTSVTDEQRRRIEDDLQVQQGYLAEFKAIHWTPPTLTYDNHLTLYHGGREFQFIHFFGNTPGDTVLYLPKEKVLLTGDLVVHPMPYASNSHHVNSWIESLKTLSRLDADILVPGHGSVQHDKGYLNLVTELLQSVVRQVHEALQRGMTLEETRKFVNLSTIRAKFTHDEPRLNFVFDFNFTAPIVKQVYDEATDENYEVINP